MAVKVYKSGAYIRIDNPDSPDSSIEYMYPSSTLPAITDQGEIRLVDRLRNRNINLGLYTNIQDKDGDVFANQELALKYLANLGSQDVNIQDQTTPPVDLYFIQALGAATTLDGNTAIDDTTITLTDTTNFIDGTYVGIFCPAENRFYFGEQLGAPTGNDIDLDTPLDFAYQDGDNVVPLTRDLNVDGSVTPQVFVVAGAGSGATVSIDITRIMISMICTTTPDDGLFGDLAALGKGIVLRRVDGETRNIWNAKTNGELANLAYDLTYTARTVPPSSAGIRTRYTFAGQDKHGVAVRLIPGDAIQLIIQDDLLTAQTSSQITQFRMIAPGHVVQD